jgi:hypothetical protein
MRVSEWLEVKLNKKDSYFAKGRLVRNLFDDIILNQSIRLSDTDHLTKETLCALQECDASEVEPEYDDATDG